MKGANSFNTLHPVAPSLHPDNIPLNFKSYLFTFLFKGKNISISININKCQYDIITITQKVMEYKELLNARSF